MLCQRGCRSVRESIRQLEHGESLPELRGLDDASRLAILNELRVIMAVYGDSCRLPAATETLKNGWKHGEKS
jgi:hypothetical protein